MEAGCVRPSRARGAPAMLRDRLRTACAGEEPWPAKSSWVLVTRGTRFLEQPALVAREAPYAPPREVLWTDQHSDLFRLIW